MELFRREGCVSRGKLRMSSFVAWGHHMLAGNPVKAVWLRAAIVLALARLIVIPIAVK
jgi:hypothetical protein